MIAQPLQHPIGFSASEISSLVNETVVSQHAEEAAFLWTLRDRAVGEPHYSLDDLAALDGRVEAHLEGLRIAGEVGWKHCAANLEILGAGEVFAFSVRAFADGDRDRMRRALAAGCSSPETRRGFVSALGWLEYEAAAPWIGRLVQAQSPEHREAGIAASAIHRRLPGAALASAIADPHPALRARGLRAVGELKRHDLMNQVRAQLRDDDDGCRFWAAYALTLNGERDGIAELARWFGREAVGMHALQVGLRALPIAEGRDAVSALVRNGDERSAVIGVGVVGDPASIPWLIRKMESPDLARLAGEAFTMITGIDLAFHDLDQDPPASEQDEDADIEEVLALDHESNLPWPASALVGRWWKEHQAEFAAGTRYLAGHPITFQSALGVLRTGTQRQRRAAALECALLDRDRVLFEVRARGAWQQRALD